MKSPPAVALLSSVLPSATAFAADLPNVEVYKSDMPKDSLGIECPNSIPYLVHLGQADGSISTIANH